MSMYDDRCLNECMRCRATLIVNHRDADSSGLLCSKCIASICECGDFMDADGRCWTCYPCQNKVVDEDGMCVECGETLLP